MWEKLSKTKKPLLQRRRGFFADHPPEFAAWTAYSTLRARVSVLREQATVQYTTPHNLRLLEVKIILENSCQQIQQVFLDEHSAFLNADVGESCPESHLISLEARTLR